MPTTKLTLSVDKRLVQKAKKLASARQTSLSAMFSRFLQALTQEEAGARERIGPLTRRASGLIKLPGDASVADLLGEALAEKYQIRK